MNSENHTRLRPGASGYPAILSCYSNPGPPPVVTVIGNPALLDGPLLGFFCSVRSPGDAILKTYDLARTLRSADVTIIGGFHSPMEKELLDLFLQGTARAIVCPARGLGKMRIPKGWKKPIAEGCLLLLSFFDDRIHRPTATISVKRNAYVATLADRLLIAHAEKGSKTEQLCKDALANGKPVFTLDSPDNAHLIELGVTPIAPEDPTPITAQAVPIK